MEESISIDFAPNERMMNMLTSVFLVSGFQCSSCNGFLVNIYLTRYLNAMLYGIYKF